MTDSLSVSTLLFSVFFLIRYFQLQKASQLLLSGLMITWSVFLRQIDLLLLPITAFYLLLYYYKNWGQIIKSGLVYGLPFVLCIGLWTTYNYQKTHRFIPLIAPFSECFKSTTPQHFALGNLVRAWGDNSVHWTAGSAGQWMLTDDYVGNDIPFGDVYTAAYNLDSLKSLRADFSRFKHTDDPEYKKLIGAQILERAERFRNAYISENPFHYYVIDRIEMTFRFLFPTALDNLPGPSFAEMNIIQKLVKLGSYALLLAVHLLGLCGIVLACLKRDRIMLLWSVIPFAFIFALGTFLGYIEQRYLAPIYPFMLVLSVYFVQRLFLKKSKV